jgi:hypothetical protein
VARVSSEHLLLKPARQSKPNLLQNQSRKHRQQAHLQRNKRFLQLFKGPDNHPDLFLSVNSELKQNPAAILLP